MNLPVVRDLYPADENAWLRLWEAYCRFYQVELAPSISATTWQRIASGEFLARGAEIEGQLTGFSVSVIHLATWTTQPVCYLEDLFVDEAARGRGLGRLLLDDLVAISHARGYARLYWHTQADNRRARALYDRYAYADDFVRYRLPISEVIS